MSRRLLARSLPALAISAVAGAAVLAPVTAVATDASPLDDVDGVDSSSTLPAPVDEPTSDTPDVPEVPDTESSETATDGDSVEPAVEDDLDALAQDEDTQLLEAQAEDEPILPDTGYGKYSQPIRIGVDLAEGTYVPEGVTTAGSVLRITETGPLVKGGTLTTECTTEESTATDGSTATFCVFNNPLPNYGPEGPFAAAAVVVPEDRDPDQDDQVYLAERGSTVTITQVSAPPGLVAGTDTATVDPCPELEVAPPPQSEYCIRQVALLGATGLPPVAVNDTATTEPGVPVEIDVLDNDDPVAGAPVTGFDITAMPENGMIRNVGGDYPLPEYTPDDGFVGTDSFAYSYTTPNGTAFATVTIVVGTPTAPPVTPVTPVVEAGPELPDTGGADAALLAWGAALVAAGAGALAFGRRRDVGAD